MRNSKVWRWTALGLVLVAGAAGLLGWSARRPEAAVAAPASVPAAAANSSFARQDGKGMVARVAQAAAASRPAPSEAQASREFIDVCGVGRVRRSELEPAEGAVEPPWSKELDRLSEQGLADVLKRLDAGSLRQRVAAAALRGDVQAAAQMAASTDDVKAYRLAVRACSRDTAYRSNYPNARQWQARMGAAAASGVEMPELAQPGPLPTACAAVSLEKLESMDPGDAWPAMKRLNDAVDEAGINQALYQLAQKSRLSANFRALSAVMAEVIGPEPTMGEAWALTVAMGTDAASSTDGMLVGVLRPCRADALKDANRRQLCEQVVRRMPGMVSEAMEASVLYALEERLGFKHGPQSLSREELNRGLQSLSEGSDRWMAEPTCSNFSSMGQQLVKLAREGELVMLRAHLRDAPASGRR